jgi:DNA-binding Lrp family transcriptional regulator
MILDATDARILEAIQEDGRLTNQDLAARIGLSPAPCWRRLKRLEETGILQRYVGLLDPEALGLTITVFASVSLENHHADTVQLFDELVRDSDEVLECYSMSGQSDYLVKVVARNMTHYEEFLAQRLMVCPAVRAVNTSFVLKRKKYTTALPVGQAVSG